MQVFMYHRRKLHLLLVSMALLTVTSLASCSGAAPGGSGGNTGTIGKSGSTATAQGHALAPLPTPSPTASKRSSGNNNSNSSNNAMWTLVFSDDFNGTQLNSTWGLYTGPHGGGRSYYSPSEVHVQGGMVHISMEQKTTNGLPYTTGGMAAFKLASTYGKYEFRARLPRGKGVGPYAILWQAAGNHGDVEVDLFESPPAAKGKVYFTNHGNGAPTQIVASGNFADTFHIFTYEWTPGKLHFLIDGVDHGILTKNVPNFPMWFALAVASGDAFTGLPDSSTVLPVSLDIDWVHIYKYHG